MDTVDRELIDSLAQQRGWPCVSLYLPVHRRLTEISPDRISLRNLAEVATRDLVRGGMRDIDARESLSGAYDLAGSADGWQGGVSGLAIFACDGSTRILHLDTPVPERVAVGDRLYLRPLFPVLRGPEHFWALALDKNGVRLLHASRTTFEEVALPQHVPTTLAEELQYDQRERQLQFQTIPGVGPKSVSGRGIAQYHGQGAEKDVDKENLDRFVTDVEHAVTTAIGADSHEPLVLLGVEWVIDAYRAANSYSGLAGEKVEGATGHLSNAEIHTLAVGVLEPRFNDARDRDLAELREKEGTGLASDDLSEVVVSAAEGRVKTLFVDDGTGPFGLLDRSNMQVQLVCDGEPELLREQTPPEDVVPISCGWDLVDLAAVETMRHGGTVYGFRGEGAPISTIAAVFRY